MFHFPRQFRYLFRGLRITLDHLPELVQLAHTLLEATLRVGWITGGVCWCRLLLSSGPRRVVAGIEIVPGGTAYRASAGPSIAVASVTHIAASVATVCRVSAGLSAIAAALTGTIFRGRVLLLIALSVATSLSTCAA
jgi:hypothetical protein